MINPSILKSVFYRSKQKKEVADEAMRAGEVVEVVVRYDRVDARSSDG